MIYIADDQKRINYSANSAAVIMALGTLKRCFLTNTALPIGFVCFFCKGLSLVSKKALVYDMISEGNHQSKVPTGFPMACDKCVQQRSHINLHLALAPSEEGCPWRLLLRREYSG